MKNNINKKLAAILTAAAMCISMLSGCTEKSEGSPDETTQTTVSENTDAAVTAAQNPLTDGGNTDNGAENAVPDDTVYIPEAEGIVSVTADSTRGELIAADTSFTVVTKEDTEADTLKKKLTLSPMNSFTVEKKSACNFIVKSTTVLPENSMTVLTVNDEKGEPAYKWAFQTEGSFEVSGVYPRDEADYVSVSTGIEISFTFPVKADKAKDFFEITPSVNGKFTSHRSTLYFIPSAPLEPGTEYTVKVKAGFPSADGAVLEEEKTISFTTSDYTENEYLHGQSNSETFVKGDTVVSEIFCSDSFMKKDFNVRLYRYKTAEDYFNAIKAFNESGSKDYRFDTEGLELVYSEKTKLLDDNGTHYRTRGFVIYPEGLDEGYYYTEIACTEDEEKFCVRRHIQISPVSVYSSFAAGKAQFFINDTDSGNAASGAEIELYTENGTLTAKADADGVATLAVPTDRSGTGILKITNGDDIYCDYYDYYKGGTPYISDLYFSYIYTDREVYRRDDTMNIFGVLIPRKKGTALPENLSLRLGDEYEEGWDIPVTIGSDGTFTAKTSFTDLSYTWGTFVTLFAGEENIARKYFQVYDYTKPTFTYDTDFPVFAVSPQSVPVKASITASLFDGTAANGIEFKASGYYVEKADPVKLVTDRNGYAETNILFKDEDNWRPSYIGMELDLVGIQDSYYGAYLSTIGFFRDVMLEYEFDRETMTFTAKTSKIVTDKLNDENFSSYYRSDEFNDIIRGGAADVKIKATLERHWTEKTPSGSYYDYLNKKNVTTYNHKYHEEIVDTYEFTTKDGVGMLKNLPTNREDSSYYLNLEWKDTQGRITTESIYLRTKDYDYDSRERQLKSYSFEADSNDFTENQVLNFNLANYGDPVKGEGRVLFQVYGHELINHTVYEGTEFTHTMTADYIPTVKIVGAYFDGRHVYPVSDSWDWYTYSFNPEEREILLDIAPDKDKYAPSDNASVTVTAKDVTGKAVAGAKVVLSVADEAAFAVSDQVTDPLNTIYADIYTTDVIQYYSYIQHAIETPYGAEKGGGDGDYTVRNDFRDTAAFLTAFTDVNGKATFTFELPDNITEWRATAVAVHQQTQERIFAGTAKKPIIVTMPLFINPIMLSKIVEGDDFSATARCYGDTEGDDAVSITLTGNGKNVTKDVPSGISANFGKLEKGEYKVLFKAERNGYTDAVELPLTVTDTFLETNVTTASDLADGIKASPVSWPMCITFFNKDYMFYTDVLLKLLEQPSERLDMRIGSAFARKELGFITEEEFVSLFESEPKDGGLSVLLPAAEGSVPLTAKICVAAPELVNKSAVTMAMYNVLNNENAYRESVSSAYLALAAMGEPVMTEIRDVLESSSFSPEVTSADFTYEDGLRLTAALALLGDYGTALEYYENFTEDAVVIAAPDGKKSVFVPGASDTALTQTAIMAASLLRHPHADMMARYLVNARQYYDSFVLELMVYLSNYVPENEGEASFSYNLDGVTKTVTLDRHFGTHIDFGEQQFNNADFKVLSGSVYTVANYMGHPSANTTDPELKVTKTLSSDTGSFIPGSLVTVTIKVSGGGHERNYYTVNDVIPSCGRYTDEAEFYSRADGQRVTLYTNSSGVAKYCFRISTSGEFVLESAAAKNWEGKWGMSARTRITVNGNEQNL